MTVKTIIVPLQQERLEAAWQLPRPSTPPGQVSASWMCPVDPAPRDMPRVHRLGFDT
jgi:hypothetical protein